MGQASTPRINIIRNRVFFFFSGGQHSLGPVERLEIWRPFLFPVYFSRVRIPPNQKKKGKRALLHKEPRICFFLPLPKQPHLWTMPRSRHPATERTEETSWPPSASSSSAKSMSPASARGLSPSANARAALRKISGGRFWLTRSSSREVRRVQNPPNQKKGRKGPSQQKHRALGKTSCNEDTSQR